MKKLLATALCSLPLALASTVYAQGGTTTPENRLPGEESADSSKNMGSTFGGAGDTNRTQQENRIERMDRATGNDNVPSRMQDGSPKEIERDRDRDGEQDIKPAGTDNNRSGMSGSTSGGTTGATSGGMTGSGTR